MCVCDYLAILLCWTTTSSMNRPSSVVMVTTSSRPCCLWVSRGRSVCHMTSCDMCLLQHILLALLTEQAAVPAEVGGEGCGSVALESVEGDTTGGDVSPHDIHGNGANRGEREGHAKAGMWRCA